jgi:hypothetical protein
MSILFDRFWKPYNLLRKKFVNPIHRMVSNQSEQARGQIRPSDQTLFRFAARPVHSLRRPLTSRSATAHGRLNQNRDI